MAKLDPENMYTDNTDPGPKVNPKSKGAFWINHKTGVTFVCTDNTKDKNKWTKSTKTTEELNNEVTTIIHNKIPLIYKPFNYFIYGEEVWNRHAKNNSIPASNKSNSYIVLNRYTLLGEEYYNTPYNLFIHFKIQEALNNVIDPSRNTMIRMGRSPNPTWDIRNGVMSRPHTNEFTLGFFLFEGQNDKKTSVFPLRDKWKHDDHRANSLTHPFANNGNDTSGPYQNRYHLTSTRLFGMFADLYFTYRNGCVATGGVDDILTGLTNSGENQTGVLNSHNFPVQYMLYSKFNDNYSADTAHIQYNQTNILYMLKPYCGVRVDGIVFGVPAAVKPNDVVIKR